MNSNPRDLNTPYPLLPAADVELTAAGMSVLDAHVQVILPAADLRTACRAPDSALPSLLRNQSLCRVMVRSITVQGQASFATVLVDTPLQAGSEARIIPVYIGRDSVPPVGESFLIMEDWPAQGDATLDVATQTVDNVEYGIPVELHPDCLVLLQAAPTITLYTRTHIPSSEDSMDEASDIVSEPVIQSGVSLTDGHNTTVEDIDGTLVLTAADGLGLGVYTVPPYDPAEPGYEGMAYKGLRTINGLQGTVSIEATGTFSVTTDSKNNEIELAIDWSAVDTIDT